MSRHHENVIWQSPDGTWARGFFERIPCGGYDCDDDSHEWCDEFDTSRFEWVSAGHPTEEAAARSWDGANPGGHTTISYDPTRPEFTARLDDLAAIACEEATKARASDPHRDRFWSHGHHYGYRGPMRQRTLEAMQRQRDAMIEAWAGHRLGCYDNRLDPGEAALSAAIGERLKAATPAETAAYETRDAEHRAALRARLAEHRERRAQEARSPRGYYSPAAGQQQRKRDEREREIEEFIGRADEMAQRRIQQRRATPAPTAPPKKATPKKAPVKKTAAKATTAQGRVPQGVPTGGQFAATAKAESQVSLDQAPATAPAAGEDVTGWGTDPWG